MINPKSPVVGFGLIAILVIGGVVYYTYTVSTQIEQENSRLNAQLMRLQANFSSLQGQVAILNAAHQGDPLILLRTWGTALASYGEKSGGVTYLRLTETGADSGVEAALASRPFNATIAGNFVQWRSVSNNIAHDKYHTIWPMVLENSPGGTNAIEFEEKDGVQEVVAMSNGVRNYLQVSWNASVPHTFKIVVVTPGARVDFYIDGNVVATLTADVPKVGFLLDAAEVKADSSLAVGVATLDVYGGLLMGGW